MAKRRGRASQKTRQEELLEILIILQFAREGVKQDKIREIVGVDANRVSKVAALLKKRGGGRG